MCEVGLEGDPPRVLDCAALRTALETGKATLENIIISVQSYSWSDLWYEGPMPKTGIRGTLNSLRGWIQEENNLLTDGCHQTCGHPASAMIFRRLKPIAGAVRLSLRFCTRSFGIICGIILN